jgi:hypothetical protein
MVTASKAAVLACLLAVLAVTLLSANVQATTSSFGKINVGTSSASTFGGIIVCNFTSPADLGDITSVEAYLSTGGTTAKAVIYSDSNGKPDALLAQSESVEVEGTGGRWVSFEVSCPGIPGGLYWLGVVLDNAGSYYYAPDAAGKAIYTTTTTNPINPFPTENSVTNSNLSVFANYTPAEGPSGASNDQNWLAWIFVGIAIAGVAVAVVLTAIVVRGKKSTLK